MKQGILTQSNYNLVNKSVLKAKVGGNLSINSTVPEHGFRKGEVLNSTEAGSTPDVQGFVGGPENVELYWFMLELFIDSDTNKCGLVKYSEFAHMMFQLVMTAKKHGLTTPAEVSLFPC